MTVRNGRTEWGCEWQGYLIISYLWCHPLPQFHRLSVSRVILSQLFGPRSYRSFPLLPTSLHSIFRQPKGRWSEAGRDRRERTGERHRAERRGPPGVSRVPSFISRLVPSPVFHSGTLLLAWRLSPKSRKERGMLDLPWLAVELREWFASTRSTFLSLVTSCMIRSLSRDSITPVSRTL